MMCCAWRCMMTLDFCTWGHLWKQSPVNIGSIFLHFPNQHGLLKICPWSVFFTFPLIILPFCFLENLYHFIILMICFFLKVHSFLKPFRGVPCCEWDPIPGTAEDRKWMSILSSYVRPFKSRKVVGVAPRNCKLNGSGMSSYTSDLVPSSLLVSHLHLTTPLVNSVLPIGKPRFREI